jgi:hypothetical protein
VNDDPMLHDALPWPHPIVDGDPIGDGDPLALVLHGEKRPALSYERALAMLPRIEELLTRLADLRGWVVYNIEQDCARELRSEVRIGDAVYTFKGAATYTIDRPDLLRAALVRCVVAGAITNDELDAAVGVVDVPARVEYRVHNGRLNDLGKRGGAVAQAISEHRTTGETPASLKRKGK